jgi:Abortive infection C-terminus
MVEKSMNELAESIETLQNLLIAQATGGQGDEKEYRQLRQQILDNMQIRDLAPRFLRTCRTLTQFWQFIKYEYQHYAERREFIWGAFKPMFERIEGEKATPADKAVSVAMHKFDSETVHGLWTKAMDRRETDPEGAITLARTLLESVCKHILDERKVAYEADSDLPGLYKTVAKALNLAPSQHSETIFKQILGGCTAVVEGLGALRNRLSDAHGQGKMPVKPAPRHAELAVNLAGAVAMFLVTTHEGSPSS